MQNNVFPACAGMSPARRERRAGYLGFPRMRGDEPGMRLAESIERPFSPHARG